MDTKGEFYGYRIVAPPIAESNTAAPLKYYALTNVQSHNRLTQSHNRYLLTEAHSRVTLTPNRLFMSRLPTPNRNEFFRVKKKKINK